MFLSVEDRVMQARCSITTVAMGFLLAIDGKADCPFLYSSCAATIARPERGFELQFHGAACISQSSLLQSPPLLAVADGKIDTLPPKILITSPFSVT